MKKLYLLLLFSIFLVTPFISALCYQESANTSNQTGVDGSCGLNYSGNYTSTPTFVFPPKVYDGDWNTFGNPGGLAVNYIKPLNAVQSTTLWEVKDIGGTYNLTILPSCWNLFTNKIHFEAQAGTNEIWWSCQNASGMQNVSYYSGNSTAFEEAIWWDVGDTPLVFLSQSYTTSVVENSSSTFVQNFSMGSALSVSNVTFTYNQTNYTTSWSSINATDYQATATIITPSVSADINKTFNWTVALTNGTSYISSSSQQTVLNLALDNCTTGTIQILNLTLADEDSKTVLNATTYNTSIKVDMYLYSNPAKTDILAYYSHWYNQSNTSRVCLNGNLSSYNLYEDTQIQYSAGIYATEFYNIQNYSLNSTSNPSENITLYDLLSSETTPYTITYKDSSYLPVNNALIQIQRKYVDEGVWRVVEVPITDANGQAIAHLVTNDVIYTFTVVKNGQVLATFTSQNAVCQNPTITDCVITLNSFLSSIDVQDFEDTLDFSYTLGYNKSSRTVSSTFSVPSGAVSWISLNITQSDALGTSVCSTGVTTSAGTLDCAIGNSFGNSTVIATLYKDGVFVAQGSFKLDQDPDDIYGGSLVILALFLMFTLIGASLSDSPVFTVIFFMVGVATLFALNLVANNGFIGGTATILYLVVAIVLIIIKGANRT